MTSSCQLAREQALRCCHTTGLFKHKLLHICSVLSLSLPKSPLALTPHLPTHLHSLVISIVTGSNVELVEIAGKALHFELRNIP
jgi:hypothetical protein